MKVDKISLEYHIRSYECDRNGTLRIVTLMNIFQDIADTHASRLGIGIEHCLAHGLAWVGANYHIKINRMPKWHEKIIVTSWPAVEKKLGAVRDYMIRDEQGNTIVAASSLWILIDYARKRPVSLRDNLPEYNVVPERALESDFAKIEDVSRCDCRVRFAVRYDDIDVNQHVNNAVYPLWASEATEKEFRLRHAPAEMEIAFKKEGLYGEEIEVCTQSGALNSLHSIKALSDGRELAKVKIRWS